MSGYSQSAKDFISHEDFFLEFSLKDLLTFLNMKNETSARNKVKNVLEQLMGVLITFNVKDSKILQHLINSLKITSVRNIVTVVSLYINPFVFYDILTSSIIFEQKFLSDYYKIMQEYENCQKLARKTYIRFVQGLFGFLGNQQVHLKDEILFRNKYNKNLVENQLKAFSKFVELVEESLNLELSVQTKDVSKNQLVPLKDSHEIDNFFKDCFLSTSDEILLNSNIKIFSKQKEKK